MTEVATDHAVRFAFANDGYGEDCHPEEPGKRWITIYEKDGDELGAEVAVLVNRKGEPRAEQFEWAQLLTAAPLMRDALAAVLNQEGDYLGFAAYALAESAQ